MLVIKDELDHFEEKFAKNYIDFLAKKSDPDPGFGSGTIIPDPTWPKIKFPDLPDRIWIHITAYRNEIIPISVTY